MHGFFTSQDWLTKFRMSQAIFDYICTELHNEIERNDTVMRNSIPVQVRVAITLWFLATNADIYLGFLKHQFARFKRMFVGQL